MERLQCFKKIGFTEKQELADLKDHQVLMVIIKVNKDAIVVDNDVGEGFFTAVGTEDWENGYSCGSCAELEYQGNIVTVNVVDRCVHNVIVIIIHTCLFPRCGACSRGWFDLGGPAWRALTNNMAPGHVYGVTSRWVTCPNSLTRGNIHVYVKPGSHAWDARFQPTQHIRPVTGMAIDGGNGWQNMAKCENFMFCKPSGITIHGQFGLRVTSDTGNIDVTVGTK